MPHAKLSRGLWAFSGRQLLASLILLLVTYPFFEDLAWGEYALTVAFSFVLLSALLAVGGRHRTLIAGLVFVLPAIAFHWSTHFTEINREDLVPLLSMTLAISFVLFNLLGYVLRAPKVDTEVLCAGISVYLLFGFLWAHFYLLIQLAVPQSFFLTDQPGLPQNLNMFESVYFSFSTLSTAAFGDIMPLSRYARTCASLESVVGVLYLAVLISRLVSLYGQLHTRSASPAEVK